MPDRLSRAQLSVITHGDRHSIRVLERLLEKTYELTPVEPGVPEAPIDGLVYGRKDSAWEEVTANAVPEAPVDGLVYGRKDAAWEEISVAIKFDDNEKLYFGDDDDSAIWYDGVDMFIDPKEVGSGRIKTNNADIDVGSTGVVYTNKICAV